MLIEYYVKRTADVAIPKHEWIADVVDNPRIGDGMKFMFDGILAAVITTKTVARCNGDLEAKVAFKYFNIPEIDLRETELCASYSDDAVNDWKQEIEYRVISLWKQSVARKLSL